jgi:hypothetical protein
MGGVKGKVGESSRLWRTIFMESNEPCSDTTDSTYPGVAIPSSTFTSLLKSMKSSTTKYFSLISTVFGYNYE